MNYEFELNNFIKSNAITGIDTSRWQGKIDWSFVESTYPWVNFGILKMRDEIYSGVDPEFYNGWASISKTTIKQMVYSVITPRKGLEQLLPTLDMVDKLEIKPAAIFLDFETPPIVDLNKAADLVNAGIAHIQNQTGIPTLLYSYFPYIKNITSNINTNNFCIANYSKLYNTYTTIPAERIKCIQYSGWIPNNNCSKSSCKLPAHNHGVYMKLSPITASVAVDQDVFLDVEYYNTLKS